MPPTSTPQSMVGCCLSPSIPRQRRCSWPTLAGQRPSAATRSLAVGPSTPLRSLARLPHPPPPAPFGSWSSFAVPPSRCRPLALSSTRRMSLSLPSGLNGQGCDGEMHMRDFPKLLSFSSTAERILALRRGRRLSCLLMAGQLGWTGRRGAGEKARRQCLNLAKNGKYSLCTNLEPFLGPAFLILELREIEFGIYDSIGLLNPKFNSKILCVMTCQLFTDQPEFSQRCVTGLSRAPLIVRDRIGLICMISHNGWSGCL